MSFHVPASGLLVVVPVPVPVEVLVTVLVLVAVAVLVEVLVLVAVAVLVAVPVVVPVETVTVMLTETVTAAVVTVVSSEGLASWETAVTTAFATVVKPECEVMTATVAFTSTVAMADLKPVPPRSRVALSFFSRTITAAVVPGFTLTVTLPVLTVRTALMAVLPLVILIT